MIDAAEAAEVAELPPEVWSHPDYVRRQIELIQERLTEVLFGDYSVVIQTEPGAPIWGNLAMHINVVINAARNAIARAEKSEALAAMRLTLEEKNRELEATVEQLQESNAKQRELALDNARLYSQSRRQEARLEQILNSTSDGIMLVDAAGAIVTANRRAAELLGLNEAASGARLVDIVAAACGAGAGAERGVARLRALLESGEGSGDGDLEIEEGGRILHWAGQPTHDGEVQGFTLTFQDVTQEREMSRMKSDFVSFAAHQLRTPLAGIKWMLEAAGEEPDLTPSLAECIIDAGACADRLIAMVGELLDVARLEAGAASTETREVDLAGLTRAVVEEVADRAAKKGHRLTATGGEAAPVVLVDDELLRQAMLSVVGNAIKYTPDGGEITVGIAEEDGWAVWSVRDNGIGIPKSAQGRLFQKFYRADNATAVDTDGRGLGLYMVRLIIQRFGGRLHWSSEEGQGTTFQFILPLARARAEKIAS
jgi:PAS domain S-box-containing protein